MAVHYQVEGISGIWGKGMPKLWLHGVGEGCKEYGAESLAGTQNNYLKVVADVMKIPIFPRENVQA